jgi:hypothetical protein
MPTCQLSYMTIEQGMGIFDRPKLFFQAPLHDLELELVKVEDTDGVESRVQKNETPLEKGIDRVGSPVSSSPKKRTLGGGYTTGNAMNFMLNKIVNQRDEGPEKGTGKVLS